MARMWTINEMKSGLLCTAEPVFDRLSRTQTNSTAYVATLNGSILGKGLSSRYIQPHLYPTDQFCIRLP